MGKRQHFSVKPKAFWYDSLTGLQYDKQENSRCQYFASTQEFNLWIQLTARLKNCNVYRQFPLLYKPETANYPPLFWKVDYCITYKNQVIQLLEVKGDWILHDSSAMQEFQHKLQYLELSNKKSWEKLIIVGSENLKIDDKVRKLSPEETIAYLVHATKEKRNDGN